MVYTAETDPLCYPGTTVLRNILDIHDQAELDEFELALFLTRADEAFPAGDLDYPHYLALHRHLFQDVYTWAGEPRAIRIGKGGNWFCYPEYIDAEMHRIFEELSAANHYVGETAEIFAAGAAHILAEINAVHPFREGNGRTQLAFLAMLADNAGYGFDDDQLQRDRVMGAMIDSFSGDEAPLTRLIRDIIA
ncbi:Fic family protein [Mesorhizobium sp. M2C.T.Ca.TU.002.02.1.1]|uniref:Fic/DOC family protein n=1 Tax=Mesorhizobium sp. M2C.T.Ca.TU.002.02.1.1 TaxID=2496788 RepID=UPI000FCBAEAE|nr:Fic family protein [Mesorhizobium sp. M2C.T.Ca.TU.002.02.1.1]RUU49463.1 adenosine monophosphate-protein transferase [Mesorhizobium sp. M2C.T.Ca.TU.002.02.1.1]RUU59138.1 adenosine monophosphate-protein transferase [Mesorhizobium sp. M2C.T.Ca.TU.009.01.2.1]